MFFFYLTLVVVFFCSVSGQNCSWTSNGTATLDLTSLYGSVVTYNDGLGDIYNYSICTNLPYECNGEIAMFTELITFGHYCIYLAIWDPTVIPKYLMDENGEYYWSFNYHNGYYCSPDEKSTFINWYCNEEFSKPRIKSVEYVGTDGCTCVIRIESNCACSGGC